MKNYEEMARDLLAKRDEYERQRKRKKETRKKRMLCVSGIAIVIVSGFGIWRSGILIKNIDDVQMAKIEMEEQSKRGQIQQERDKTAEKEGEEKKNTEEENYQIENFREDIESSNKKKYGRDKSVSAVNPVDLEKGDYSKVLENNISTLNRSSLEDTISSIDLSYLSKQATEIVAGTVKKVTYDVIKGCTWTKVDIRITDVFKGDLIAGDIISIYRPGGYIALTEYRKYHKDAAQFETDTKKMEQIMLKQVFDEEEFPEAGEKSVFYLNPTSSGTSLPKGAYERIDGKYSELIVTENKLLKYRDDDTTLFTWEEIQENVDKWNK